jgi:hypothetical protein
VSDTPKLAAALVAFQAEMPTVHKGKTAIVPTKAGGQYRYSYADLADVTKEAMPILTKHGLAFSSRPVRAQDGSFELEGVLLHASGETLTGSLPIKGNSPQEIGSSLTYNRRYLFGCLTGVVTDVDEDGPTAGSAKRTRNAEPPVDEPKDAPAPTTRTMSRTRKAEQPAETGEAMTDKQRGMLMPLFLQAGIHTQENRHAYAENVIGRPIKASNDMTKAEVSKVIDALLQDIENPPPEQPPDALL